jgi:hypothetical protein
MPQQKRRKVYHGRARDRLRGFIDQATRALEENDRQNLRTPPRPFFDVPTANAVALAVVAAKNALVLTYIVPN